MTLRLVLAVGEAVPGDSFLRTLRDAFNNFIAFTANVWQSFSEVLSNCRRVVFPRPNSLTLSLTVAIPPCVTHCCSSS
jgi:hypothetical protein